MDFHVLLYLRHLFQTDPSALWKPENIRRVAYLSKELLDGECKVYILNEPKE